MDTCAPPGIHVYANEVADALAKSGGRLKQVKQPASYLESKTLINTAWRKAWQAEDPPYSHSIDHIIHRLSRKYRRAIFRLRIGLLPSRHTQSRQRQFSCLLLWVRRANGRTYHTGLLVPSRPQDEIHGLYQTPWEKLWGSLASLAQTSSCLEDAEILI